MSEAAVSFRGWQIAAGVASEALPRSHPVMRKWKVYVMVMNVAAIKAQAQREFARWEQASDEDFANFEAQLKEH